MFALEEKRKQILKQLADEFLQRERIVYIKESEFREINTVNEISIDGINITIPNRVTANVIKGSGKIKYLDYEAGNCDPIYAKAIMTVDSYIRNTHRIPSDKDIIISHEQEYYKIQGNASTLAEALLIAATIYSAPIKQNVIIIGTIDQFGTPLPVKAINTKIKDILYFLDITKTNNCKVAIPNNTKLHDDIPTDRIVKIPPFVHIFDQKENKYFSQEV